MRRTGQTAHRVAQCLQLRMMEVAASSGRASAIAESAVAALLIVCECSLIGLLSRRLVVLLLLLWLHFESSRWRWCRLHVGHLLLLLLLLLLLFVLLLRALLLSHFQFECECAQGIRAGGGRATRRRVGIRWRQRAARHSTHSRSGEERRCSCGKRAAADKQKRGNERQSPDAERREALPLRHRVRFAVPLMQQVQAEKRCFQVVLSVERTSLLFSFCFVFVWLLVCMPAQSSLIPLQRLPQSDCGYVSQRKRKVE